MQNFWNQTVSAVSNIPTPLRTTFVVIGAIWLTSKVLSSLISFATALIPSKNLGKRYGYNSYAVVTGASDGIGKGFCFALAARGFNICLIARNRQKLENVAKELKDSYPKVETLIVVADFKQSFEPGFYGKITAELEKIDVSILVNNVGFDIVKHFTDISESEIRDVITVNCVSQAMMTRKLINNLLDRKQRGAIINVASAAATIPVPYLQIYSGTKAFNDFFSRALAEEFPQLDIISLRPGYVSTQLNLRKRPSFDTLTPIECAEGCLKDLGKSSYTFGNWRHGLLGSLISSLPEWLFYKIWTGKLGINFIKERAHHD